MYIGICVKGGDGGVEKICLYGSLSVRLFVKSYGDETCTL